MVDLALAKQHLEYEADDRDDLILQYIASAAAWVEGYTGLLLTRRQATIQFDDGLRWLDLPVGPDPEIDAITYLDSDFVQQEMAIEDYALVGKRVYPLTSFPSAPYGLSVAVTAGYVDDTPADLLNAQLLLIGEYFANREVGSASPSVAAAVESLCRPYRSLLV